MKVEAPTGPIAPGYETLARILSDAFDQAAHGKGKERHAQAMPFDAQPMQKLVELYGPGFALGQAAKKMQESQRLPHDRARAELLGAIVYVAGAVVAMDRAALDCRVMVEAAAPAHGCALIDGCSKPAMCARLKCCQA